MTERVIIRLPRSLFAAVQRDLMRPHPFAAERVGFLFARYGTGPEHTHLLCPLEYWPVPDDQYVAPTDPLAGAAIGGEAIRGAMQRVMRKELTGLHVHLHDHGGCPRFSPTDWRDVPGLAQSLANASPSRIHGALVFSRDNATGAVWIPTAEGTMPCMPTVSVIGYPLSIARGES